VIAGLVLFDTTVPNLTRELLTRWPEFQGLPPEVAVTRALRVNLWPSTRVVLVAGTELMAETVALSQNMAVEGVPHRFLDRSNHPHRWDSGWLEAAVSVGLESSAGLRGGNLPTFSHAA